MTKQKLEQIAKECLPNDLSLPNDTHNYTIRERVHQLLKNGIMVKSYDNESDDTRDRLSNDVDLTRGFTCFQDGIEVYIEHDEQILEHREFEKYEREIYRHLIIPNNGTDNEYVFEFYLKW